MSVPTSTTVVAVKQEIVRRLTSRPELAGVAVTYSSPGRDLQRAAIYFVGYTGTSSIAVLRAGRQSIDERYDLRLELMACGPGQAGPEAEQAAFGYRNVLADELANDPFLGGLLLSCELTASDGGVTADFEGWDGVLHAVVSCHARIY